MNTTEHLFKYLEYLLRGSADFNSRIDAILAKYDLKREDEVALKTAKEINMHDVPLLMERFCITHSGDNAEYVSRCIFQQISFEKYEVQYFLDDFEEVQHTISQPCALVKLYASMSKEAWTRLYDEMMKEGNPYFSTDGLSGENVHQIKNSLYVKKPILTIDDDLMLYRLYREHDLGPAGLSKMMKEENAKVMDRTLRPYKFDLELSAVAKRLKKIRKIVDPIQVET